jgi:hypothetical protein
VCGANRIARRRFMLRLNGQFKSLEWKTDKNRKEPRTVAIIRVEVPLPVDINYVSELEQDRVRVTYTNPAVSMVVEGIGELGETRPVDSHLLLVNRDENQNILFKIVHDSSDFPPDFVLGVAQLTQEPETVLSMEIERYTPQLSLFDEGEEDDEFVKDFA